MSTARPTADTVEVEIPPTISARDLVRKEFPEPRWAVPGLLPVGLAFLAGKPKMGKSWLSLSLGIAIGSGGRALGRIPVEVGEVLYLALEDRQQRLKTRLLMLADEDKLPRGFILSTEWPRQGKGGLDKIEAYLQKNPATRLVIIDTLVKFRRRADKMIRSQYDEDYATGEAIKNVADRYDCCILVIAHLRKLDAEDAFDTISGTLGLTGAADTILVLKRDRGRADAVLAVTGRDVDEQELAMKFDPQTVQWTIVGDAEEYRLGRKQAEVVKVLEEAGEALKIRDIAKLTGQSEPACRKMLSELAGLGKVKRVADGFYMAIGLVSAVTSEKLTRGNTAHNIDHNQGANGASLNSNGHGASLDGTSKVVDFESLQSRGNRGNEVTEGVTPVSPVTSVSSVTPVTPNVQDAMLCLDCGKPLPTGFYFRCPSCEERIDMERYTR